MASAMPEFYTSEPHFSPLFNSSDSGGVASFFNDNASVFGSPGISWSDPYSSCTSSSYNAPGATFDFACASPQLVYPTEDDVILLGGDDSEFLQQALNGCNLEMYPNLVNTLKHLTTPPASPETQYFQYQEVNHFHHERRAFLEQQLGLTPESPQMSPSNESELSSLDVTYSVDSDEVVVKHEPPPLNNKVETLFSRPRFMLLRKIWLWSTLGELMCEVRMLRIGCAVGRAEVGKGGVHRRQH